MINDKVKEFIEATIDFIEKDNWEAVYRKADRQLGYRRSVGEFTAAMLEAGLNPLSYLNYIPTNYLAGYKGTEFNIPKHIVAIKDYAFIDTQLKNMIIPKNVSRIEEGVFSSCLQLESVVFENNGIHVSSYAFQSCKSLIQVSFPKDFTLDYNSFFYCPSLVEIEYRGTKEEWEYIVHDCGILNSGTYAEMVHCSDGDVKL